MSSTWIDAVCKRSKRDYNNGRAVKFARSLRLSFECGAFGSHWPGTRMHVEHIAADRSLDKHSMCAQRSRYRMSCRSNGNKLEYLLNDRLTLLVGILSSCRRRMRHRGFANQSTDLLIVVPRINKLCSAVKLWETFRKINNYDFTLLYQHFNEYYTLDILIDFV